MTAPTDGRPCVCDDRLAGYTTTVEVSTDGVNWTGAPSMSGRRPLHEHAEFEPYACADCNCERFWPAGTTPEPPETPPHSNGDEQTGGSEGYRPHLVIPAQLDFAAERVQTAAQWLDQITTSTTANLAAANEPLAVCALADLIEQNWPDGLDPFDVLAIAIRRLAATPGDSSARRFVDTIRRKVQR
ncbi:hypothetical protein [Mycobacterium asiaticum]|uniref:Uncharacterized protein n=1 Tax=Mycobacterium asiaticum TaxID=1790 RepID=A0A1A3NN87_MYCAS|nr:hypothetical protein [Mycobacterium asiaticum]OBK22544.1 hypothetical protein A5635_21755 [Mycobacterium asiaticum]